MKSIILGGLALAVSVMGYVMQMKVLLVVGMVLGATGLLGSMVSLGNEKKNRILVIAGIMDSVSAIALAAFFWIAFPDGKVHDVEKMFDEGFEQSENFPGMKDLEREAREAEKEAEKKTTNL